MSALDDRGEPIAEICRQVALVAERLGLVRPSYVHFRRLLLAERSRVDAARRQREELLAIAGDVYWDATRGFLVDAYDVAARIQEARLPKP